MRIHDVMSTGVVTGQPMDTVRDVVVKMLSRHCGAIPIVNASRELLGIVTLRDVMLPRVIGKTFNSPEGIAAVNAPFKGNRMAKAVIEMAFWDLWARSLNTPLNRLLGGARDAVPVGVSDRKSVV